MAKLVAGSDIPSLHSYCQRLQQGVGSIIDATTIIGQACNGSIISAPALFQLAQLSQCVTDGRIGRPARGGPVAGDRFGNRRRDKWREARRAKAIGKVTPLPFIKAERLRSRNS